jgi:hypothetical protein
MSQSTDIADAPTTDVPSDEQTEPATVPAKGKAKPKAEKKAKVEKPKVEKDPLHPFGTPKVGTPKANVRVPTDEKLKAYSKGGLRRVVSDVTGLNHKATLWLTPRELRIILKGELPFDSKGLEVDGVTVRTLEEAYDLAVQRKNAWSATESGRIKERNLARSEQFGEAFDGIEPGTAEFINRYLGDKAPLVPVTGIVQKLPQGTRFYDADGRAGRTSYYEFIAQSDRKVDGKPKANAVVYRISPQVVDVILGDDSLKQILDVPEGFNKPEPKPKKEAKAPSKQPKKAGKKPRRSVTDALAADAGDDTTPAEEPVEQPADEPVADAAPADLDIPEL